MKFLFFDDKNILSRTGVERRLGAPELIGKYDDPFASTSTGMPSIWYDEENKKYHMFYNSCVGHRYFPLAAISDDGIHFVPRNTAIEAGIENPIAPNLLLPVNGGELAYVYEDKLAPKEERLKAFFVAGKPGSVRIIHNYLYTSADGIRWKKQEQEWHNRGAEPGAMCFYNKVTGKHTIISRPDPGVRRLGLIETEDFKTFTNLRLVMSPDSLDEPLCEHYGMPIFPYGDIFVGFLWLYKVPNIRQRKYYGGVIEAELVYSYNGISFNRSLRKPFFANDASVGSAGLVMPSDMYRGTNGELLVSAGISQAEHGYFSGNGQIAIYKLREDGFISFNAKNDGEIITIPMVYGGGDITVNVNCEHFSCALFTDDSIDEPMNLLCHNLLPLEGYSHEEFNSFSGDEISKSLSWKNSDLEALKGKVIYIEMRIRNGDIYSLNGNLTPMMICDLARYHLYGILPDLNGIG